MDSNIESEQEQHTVHTKNNIHSELQEEMGKGEGERGLDAKKDDWGREGGKGTGERGKWKGERGKWKRDRWRITMESNIQSEQEQHTVHTQRIKTKYLI